MLSFDDAITQALVDLENQYEARFGDDAAIDIEDGVLRVEMADGRVYLFNRHTPLQQLWLSSPQSGAWHFTYAPFADRHLADWRSTRGDKISLYDLLNRELMPVLPFQRPPL
jgi:frataxin